MRKAKSIGEAIETAIELALREQQTKIEEFIQKNSNPRYIKPERVGRKINSFHLSSLARDLLHHIESREASGKPVSYTESFGINWNILRCLLTRAIVTWNENDQLVVFRRDNYGG